MKVVISKQQMPLGLAPQASLVTTSMPLQEKLLLNDEKNWQMESGAAIQQNVEPFTNESLGTPHLPFPM